jgi:hypothetical protein
MGDRIAVTAAGNARDPIGVKARLCDDVRKG